MTCIHKEWGAADIKDHHLPPIIRITDELWDEFRKILPGEKPSESVGRPIIPYRKVLDGILYVLRTGCQWKIRCYLKNMVLVQHAIGDFRNGITLMFSKRHVLDY